MSIKDDAGRSERTRSEAVVDGPPVYEPPRIERLGSLQDLTLGGTVGPDDHFGGAGDAGSI